MAGREEQGQPEEGVVLAQQAVGEDRPDHRQGVDARHEGVGHGRGRVIGGLLRHARVQIEGRQVHVQDGLHPVEAEALAALMADDVRDAGGSSLVVVVGGGLPPALLLGYLNFPASGCVGGPSV